MRARENVARDGVHSLNKSGGAFRSYGERKNIWLYHDWLRRWKHLSAQEFPSSTVGNWPLQRAVRLPFENKSRHGDRDLKVAPLPANSSIKLNIFRKCSPIFITLEKKAGSST